MSFLKKIFGLSAGRPIGDVVPKHITQSAYRLAPFFYELSLSGNKNVTATIGENIMSTPINVYRVPKSANELSVTGNGFHIKLNPSPMASVINDFVPAHIRTESTVDMFVEIMMVSMISLLNNPEWLTEVDRYHASKRGSSVVYGLDDKDIKAIGDEVWCITKGARNKCLRRYPDGIPFEVEYAVTLAILSSMDLEASVNITKILDMF